MFLGKMRFASLKNVINARGKTVKHEQLKGLTFTNTKYTGGKTICPNKMQILWQSVFEVSFFRALQLSCFVLFRDGFSLVPPHYKKYRYMLK